MDIFGISLSKLVYKDFFVHITAESSSGMAIFTPNPEILLIAQGDSKYADNLKKADYLLPDGIGLYIAFQILDSQHSAFVDTLLLPLYIAKVLFSKRRLYAKYGERICGSDLTKDLLYYAEHTGRDVIVVDLYNPTDLKKTASQELFVASLKTYFPDLKLHYFIWQPEKKQEIMDTISTIEKPFLFSSLGMKRQEENILQIMESCENIKLAM